MAGPGKDTRLPGGLAVAAAKTHLNPKNRCQAPAFAGALTKRHSIGDKRYYGESPARLRRDCRPIRGNGPGGSRSCGSPAFGGGVRGGHRTARLEHLEQPPFAAALGFLIDQRGHFAGVAFQIELIPVIGSALFFFAEHHPTDHTVLLRGKLSGHADADGSKRQARFPRVPQASVTLTTLPQSMPYTRALRNAHLTLFADLNPQAAPVTSAFPDPVLCRCVLFAFQRIGSGSLHIPGFRPGGSQPSGFRQQSPACGPLPTAQ